MDGDSIDVTTRTNDTEAQSERSRHRQQIERLLGCRGVGPLAADAIAVNLAVPPGTLDTLLAELAAAGRIVRDPDGRFALPLPEGRT